MSLKTKKEQQEEESISAASPLYPDDGELERYAKRKEDNGNDDDDVKFPWLQSIDEEGDDLEEEEEEDHQEREREDRIDPLQLENKSEHPRFLVVKKSILESMNLESLCVIYTKLESDKKRPEFIDYELEAKFGTRDLKKSHGIDRFTRSDYDHVIKRLVANGYTVASTEGEHLLRISEEKGRVRTEIKGLFLIGEYCKTNDISSLPNGVRFINKYFAEVAETADAERGTRIWPVNFDDFNFRVSLQKESKLGRRSAETYCKDWREKKKFFRYLNRVRFESPNKLFDVDISIVRTGTSRTGVHTIEESNVFQASETYEIEIEVNNHEYLQRLREGTTIDLPFELRQVIKIVLSGLQQTNYPVGYLKQQAVLESYIKILQGVDQKENRKEDYRVTGRQFLGPNAVTLQLANLAPKDANSSLVNVREDFAVTDKADGERHLLFVGNEGDIYFLDSAMKVKFSGAKTLNKDLFLTILDGELVLRSKDNDFLNWFLAFDIYYYHNVDVRKNIFMFSDAELAEERKKNKKLVLDQGANKDDRIKMPRMNLMLIVCQELETLVPVTAINKKKDDVASVLKSPIEIIPKKFVASDESIFKACAEILSEQNDLPYNMDGLIFTHRKFGVGSNKIGEAGPKHKVTWMYSLKWKPPHYNTFDFLVSIAKDGNGQELVEHIFEPGTNVCDVAQQSMFKMLILHCGYMKSEDGHVNPCRDVLDGKLLPPTATYQEAQREDRQYHPERFYPSDPYDEHAGIAKILLKPDSTGGMQMFTSEDREVITDKMIVEFSFDFSREPGFQWIPLRIRHDKTAKYRLKEREFGNSYKVCNDIWRSIQPDGRITDEMLKTGNHIPTVNVNKDIYYNTHQIGKLETMAMKNFHNLYVKRKLILAVSDEDETLIDFAVGKAGDLPKWISARLSFVLGIDISKDNLENKFDGACARFLDTKRYTHHMPYCIFLHGNCSYNINNGAGIVDANGKEVIQVLLHGRDLRNVGDAVHKYRGIGTSGFHVSSCQFAIHYFFKNMETFKGFMENVAENTKKDGYFIGTCYDGQKVFDGLRDVAVGDSVIMKEHDKKIWELQRRYTATEFLPNTSSLGYEIKVFQESINQFISEYLVNFEFFKRVMNNYGFKELSLEEATELGLPSGIGSFESMYRHMMTELESRMDGLTDIYGDAPKMTESEKKISFLNNFFVFKKVRIVDIKKVIIDEDEVRAVNKNISDSLVEDDAQGKKKKQKTTTAPVRVVGTVVLGKEEDGDSMPKETVSEEVKAFLETSSSSKKPKKTKKEKQEK